MNQWSFNRLYGSGSYEPMIFQSTSTDTGSYEPMIFQSTRYGSGSYEPMIFQSTRFETQFLSFQDDLLAVRVATVSELRTEASLDLQVFSWQRIAMPRLVTFLLFNFNITPSSCLVGVNKGRVEWGKRERERWRERGRESERDTGRYR